MPAANLHACAVALRGRGVLIAGPSGSGKTRLALTLIRQARSDGFADAMLVADDQVLVSAGPDGRPLATVPDTIFGLVEIRGVGPTPVEAARQCVLDLAVRLVPEAQAPRMAAPGAWEAVAGCRLPRLDLPERDADGAVLAVNAFLFGTPW